jgi:hypothetical protein
MERNSHTGGQWQIGMKRHDEFPGISRESRDEMKKKHS